MTAQTSNFDFKIRKLWKRDQDAIRDHFLRLDRGSRRMRFAAAVSDAFVESYTKELLSYDAVIFGAFCDGELRAVAELRGLFHSWPMSAEAAFTVESGWQDIGIGEALFNRLVSAAQNRGVKRLNMLCLRENDRMRHLARKHHAVLEFHEGEVEATLAPPWPTPMSLTEELIGETTNYARNILHLMA
ncbi:Acetyltransferase Pat [Roseovarius litorisediminis]|uniref:Acetyltransferase Pat n=1 Tax=Roseovarius litorisediminis TaxID=1312363 RepID=A0A1Y5RNW4_9RHOB|nr:GNAT family N-acetyltransferase [Roseovarius litorisediminis]SLN20723.1 Acetyltransferase Pat [Roseovarius litorisediminis]